MIKTGIKKEFMLLTRKGKLIALIIIILAFALIDPISMRLMQSMMEIMPELYEAAGQSGETVSAIESMSTLFGDFSPASMASQCVSDIAGTASIVLMFVFMSAAGGEQKKRSVIMPHCAGLTPTMYVAPKFIIYPLLVFVLSFGAIFLGTWVSTFLFEGPVDYGLIALCALSVAMYMAFLTILQLTIGLSTGRPGAAIVASISATLIIPSMLSMFRVDRFNPFALRTLALNAALLSGGGENNGVGLGAVLEGSVSGTTFDYFDFCVSFIVTAIICVMLYLTTVFAISAKELHNEGDDPVL